MSVVRRETLAYASSKPSQTSPVIDKDDQFLDHWLPKATPYIDANWEPASGIKPSSLLGIRYCALMTGGDEGQAEAARLSKAWRVESRRRYRSGFFANPLGEPISRIAASIPGEE